MFGAMIGDIVGSVYEFDNIKTKEFPFFAPECEFTDDTVMTVAVAKALLRMRKGEAFSPALIEEMQALGRRYPDCGYGGMFTLWLLSGDTQPYNSFGNGSAMRVSPCGLVAQSLEEAVSLAARSAAVTHNHPEGIKGAEATAAAVFLARQGRSKEEIAAYIRAHYYPLERTVEEIRPVYRFNETCQESVPEAIQCFLESESYEDTIRTVISIGGDSDTLAAIAGAIAWSYYGPDPALKEAAKAYLPAEFVAVAEELEQLCHGVS